MDTNNIDLSKIFRACGFLEVDEDLSKDINKIIDWEEKLHAIDIDYVEPMFTTIDYENFIYNEDVCQQDDAKILANAPDESDNFFLVPKVIKS